MKSSRPHIGLIGIDAWLGGAIYTQNLIKALCRLPDDERPRLTLFCRRDTDLFPEVTPLVDKVVLFDSMLGRAFGNTKLAGRVQRIDYAASSFFLGDSTPALGRAAKRENVDALFPVPDPYTRLTPNPIAWIPDLQHSAYPQFFSPLQRKVRDKRFSTLLNDPNRHVVFSSQCALDHAISVYGQPRSKTYILHFATVPQPSWFIDPAPVVAKYALETPYFIVCNQFWIHKDHPTVFRGIAKLKQQGLKVNIVCTGPTKDPRQPEYFDKVKAEISQLGVESQVKILGVIPRTDQISLMRSSAAVLQPSNFEGWSTVIEDARLLGKPVIASDFPVHLEQDVPGSSYFRMGNADAFAVAIKKFMEKKQEPSTWTPATHDARILDFARTFLNICNQAYPLPQREMVQV